MNTQAPTAITVMMGETFYRGQRRPWRTDYRCVGPDGTVFTNTSKGTLESVVRRKYGKCTFTYVIDSASWRSKP